MRPNPLMRNFESGDSSLGGWLSTPLPIAAEILASQDLDYVCVDMQHGLIDFADLPAVLAGITGRGPTPIVRVPWNTPDHIGKALDAGAMGVIVPMVNSQAECEAVVHSASYPPRGGRSHGPSRPIVTEGSDYVANANDSVAIIPMVETVEALQQLDGILSVEGVTATYVGPADLGISMGLKPGDDTPEFLTALDLIVERCAAHGVAPGIHATVSTAQDRLDRGFRMVTITADLVAMRTKVAADVAAVRRGASQQSESIY